MDDKDAEIERLRAELAAKSTAGAESKSAAPQTVHVVDSRPAGSGFQRGFTGCLGVVAAIVVLCIALVMCSSAIHPSSSGSASSSGDSSANQPTSLPVKLGRGFREFDVTKYPVQLTNTTGETLGYAAAHCDFYNKAGTLVASEFTNWTDVPAGEHVSGTIYVKVSDASRYECRGSTN